MNKIQPIWASFRQAWWVLSGFFALVVLLGLSHKAHAELSSNLKIVSLDASATETIYALGKQSLLVGRDVTSKIPKEAEKLPSVGYVRALSAEGILSLNPNVILAPEDAKPRKVLDQLEEAGIRVVILPSSFDLAGVKQRIEMVGEVVGKTQQANELAQKVHDEVAQLQKELRASTQKLKSGLFLLGARKGNLMVSGRETRAHQLMEFAGIKNPAAETMKAYKPLTTEAALMFQPEVLVTFSHSLRMSGGENQVLDHPALAMTPAGKQGALVVIENSSLNFGPSLAKSVKSLHQAVYFPEKNK